MKRKIVYASLAQQALQVVLACNVRPASTRIPQDKLCDRHVLLICGLSQVAQQQQNAHATLAGLVTMSLIALDVRPENLKQTWDLVHVRHVQPPLFRQQPAHCY